MLNTLFKWVVDNRPQIIRFVGATVLSTIVSVGGAVALKEIIGIAETKAVAISLTAAFVFNFLTMRYFVFRSRTQPIKQLLHFGVSSAGFRVAEYAIFYIIYDLLGLNYLVCLIFALTLSFICKYLYHSQFTFRDQ